MKLRTKQGDEKMTRKVNSLYDVEKIREKAIDVKSAVEQAESTLRGADALVERYLQSSKRDNQLVAGNLACFENKPSRFSSNQNSTYEVFELRRGQKILVAQYN